MSDPREAAARYRRANGSEPVEPRSDAGPATTSRERAAYVETAIQQAIRRGDFDDLPGAGKPLPGLGATHDPDWWIRQKIEAEGIRGLGPPALMLRAEFAALDASLDALHREQEVRGELEDFNRRVIEARRQLLGGPPVVTPLVDVDERVLAWHERRDAAARALAEARAAASAVVHRPTWRERRAARRSARRD
jgi:hypothetical protein